MIDKPEYESCEMTHAAGTTHYHPAKVAADIKRWETAHRLEYLRSQIEAERISYGEIAELQSLTTYIDPSDVVLLEWAGVPEYPKGDPS